MATTMTPSKPMTGKQVEKLLDNLRAKFRKHLEEINSEAAQEVLGQPEAVEEMFEVFRRRVEAVSNLIVRRVPVNRNRSPQEMLDATGRAQYTDPKVVDAMPRGTGDEVEVVFFKPLPEEYTSPGFIYDDDLEKAYQRRNLVPAFPDDLAAVNEADPSFADEHPNATHWKQGGRWCFISFRRWCDERSVRVGRGDNGWGDAWSFAGLRKPARLDDASRSGG